ncbi:MAG: hypothetical protein AB8B48_20320 [Pseudomonadales bacterium]
MRHDYYYCDDESLKTDILRAAFNSEASNYTLEVYALGTSGNIKRYSSTVNNERRNTTTRGAIYAVTAAIGAVIASVLFLPLLNPAGQLVYSSLIMLVALLGGWAGGAFSRAAAPSGLRAGLRQLKQGHLFIVAQGDKRTQETLRQALARYSNVLPKEQIKKTAADTKVESNLHSQT